MPEITSEMKKREILRLSNKESNKITRECIETALILLMAEKEYNEITICEIVKRAGVSRTAYYRNYESKEDVLKNLLNDVIANINVALSQISYLTEQESYWKTLFVTIKVQYKSFCTLLKAGFGHTILEEMTKHRINISTKEDTKNKYDIIFWSGAIYNILANWVQEGMKETEDEMARICLFILENFNKEYS